MLTITTSKATVLAVRLPKGETNVRLMGNKLHVGESFVYCARFELPEGSWQPLGFSNMISESDMERIVEGWRRENGKIVQGEKNQFPNYMSNGLSSNPKEAFCNTASESYETWKSKHGISEEHYLLIKQP